MGKNNSRVDTLAADQAMIDGITKNLSKLPATLIVGSQTMTPAQLVALFQGRINTAKAVIAAEATHAAAVKANNTQRQSTAATALAFKQLITAMFKESPDVLGDFGLEPPKVPQKSAATKAKAAEKGDATRKALGTKGKAQKKEALAQASTPAPEPAPAPAPAVVSPAPTKPAS